MWGKFKTSLYCLYDQWRGVDFHEEVLSSVDGSNILGHMKYTPSGYRRMRVILTFLQSRIQRGDAIIDLGCGKGKCLELFSQLPFSRVDGLEYSEELAETARRNMNVLGLNSSIYNEDVMTFSNYDIYNYIYMYNPFQGEVFLSMTKNLKDSLERFPRKMTLIYANPVCHNELIDAGFILEEELPQKTNIYYLQSCNSDK